MYLLLVSGLLAFVAYKWWKGRQNTKSVVILVLGDVGRSPRMQRHGYSSLRHLPKDFHVHFIGFHGSTLIKPLSSRLKLKKTRLHFHKIWSVKMDSKKTGFLGYAIFKVFSESLSLLYLLLLNPTLIPNLHALIMQNPPAIPSAIIARMATWVRRAQFIIDWHNFGFSILALKLKLKIKFFFFLFSRGCAPSLSSVGTQRKEEKWDIFWYLFIETLKNTFVKWQIGICA